MIAYAVAMRSDRFGLPASTASNDALAAYDAGVEALLTASPDPEAPLLQAIAIDPGFALAHAALARCHQVQARLAEARAAIAAATDLVQTTSPREQGHVRVLWLAINGQGAAALDTLKDHLRAFPRDAVPLSAALGVYGLIGFSGRVDHHAEQRALLEWLLPNWPEHGWFLGYLGWSEIETGDAARGSDTVDRALALLPANANAAHARAHGYFELGRALQGTAFVSDWLQQHYAPRGILHGHLHWHCALGERAGGDAGAALSRYGASIEHSSAPAMPRLADGASFLWRCHLAEEVGAPRWQAMAELTARSFAQSGLAFADLHAAMVEAATGCAPALERRIEALDRRVVESALPAGKVVPTLCRALAAYAAKDWSLAVDLLETALPDLPRIGGSNAQRDVFLDTLAAACRHAGQPDRARALLGGRPYMKL
jgi:Tfp pilus assembly protein PilF